MHAPTGAFEQVVPQAVAPPVLMLPAVPPVPPLLVPAVALAPPLLVPAVALAPPLLLPAVAVVPPTVPDVPPLAGPVPPCPELPRFGGVSELVEQPAATALTSTAPARTARATVIFLRGIVEQVGRIVIFAAPSKNRRALAFEQTLQVISRSQQRRSWLDRRHPTIGRLAGRAVVRISSEDQSNEPPAATQEKVRQWTIGESPARNRLRGSGRCMLFGSAISLAGLEGRKSARARGTGSMRRRWRDPAGEASDGWGVRSIA